MLLTDAQWARIEPLLPDRTPKRGGRWRYCHQVIDASAFKYHRGTPWMGLPERFGSWKGAHSRLRMWAIDGTWERVFAPLLARPTWKRTWTGSSRWTPRVCVQVIREYADTRKRSRRGPAQMLSWR
ncbi:transposase [Streptomyces sp. NPDC048551]|uniref:transposase n=1 Tax=Streptomyces sp. NPDC048551 TaxID=3155758 RepID=UPI00342FC27E